MLDHMWSFRIGSMCWISGLLEQYNMYKQGWCNQRRAATIHTITSSEILNWCFEAAVLEAVVGGHMLNVTTVSRQPRATPLTHCHFSAMTDRRRNDRKNRAEKWRKSGIVRNCLRWLRSWGLGKSVEERGRGAADKKQRTAICTFYMGPALILKMTSFNDIMMSYW